MLPGSQLGADSLTSLRKLAEQFPPMAKCRIAKQQNQKTLMKRMMMFSRSRRKF
ncbi:unnamed protein product [Gulo gulo]|uniref:Uncharacterized protein n=1 Tax=Gulo gulo TaxID=48420 RepID=A0A9X9Q1J4_GULGU|nr:unnamed protein product [Gulo gulo]